MVRNGIVALRPNAMQAVLRFDSMEVITVKLEDDAQLTVHEGAPVYGIFDEQGKLQDWHLRPGAATVGH